MARHKKKQRNGNAPEADLAGGSPEPSPVSTFASVLAVALGLLLFLRPLIDGLVFAQYNAYFSWGAMLVVGCWAAIALLRGERISVGLSGWLLIGFVAFAALTSGASISRDETNHVLPLWATYALLFVCLRNLCTDRRARSICLAFLGASIVFECVYSIFHLNYVLPIMRLELNTNTDAVGRFFQAGGVTAEIRHRLESNRAFGSFMFPNALAGFVILGIPWGVAGVLRTWPELRAARAEKPFGHKPELSPISAALTYLIGPAIAALFLYQVVLFLLLQVSDAPVTRGTLISSTAVQTILLFFVPLFLSFSPAFLVWRFGFAAAGQILRALLYPVLTVLCVYVLWLTASRGAMLGTIAAFGLWAVIHWSRAKPSAGRWLKVGAAVSCALILLPILGAEGQAQEPDNDLAISGRETTLSDLANVSTMRLRLHYWRVGSSMIAEHPGTGVGLGNFVNAYSHFRYQGAPYVQMAHNDYLQMFAETGVAGGVLFTSFWVVFVLWGIARMTGLEDRSKRLAFGGVFLGVVAFAAHQAVDFGFQNPSLAFAVFSLAGICVATDPPGARGRAVSKGALVAVLCLTALTAGATSRMYLADGRLASLGAIRELLQSAVTLLNAGDSEDPNEVDYIEAYKVTALVDNSNELNSMGYFAAPAGEQAIRNGGPAFQRIPMDPVLPPETVFIIENPKNAHVIGQAAAQRWIERAEVVDAAYPYRWKLAFDIYQMNEVIVNASGVTGDKKPYVAACIRWAETFLERNPYNGYAHMVMGKALWYRGDEEEAAEPGSGIGTYQRALGAFVEATHYNESEAELWRVLAERTTLLAELFESRGETEKSESLYDGARKAWIRAGELLWTEARSLNNQERAGHWFAALMSWRNPMMRETTHPERWESFGQRLDDYAYLLESLGRTAEAEAYHGQADEARNRAEMIRAGAFE